MGDRLVKSGRDRAGLQAWRYVACGRRQTECSASAFSGYRYPQEVIALAVRWYLRQRLSYCEVVEWLAERGMQVDASTLFDWVQTFTPLFVEAAQKYGSVRTQATKRQVGRVGQRRSGPASAIRQRSAG